MGKLGYSSLTLTDITETIPISLTLQSNLGNNVQTRTGSIYSPDFTEEELIITPLLYMGSSQIEVPTGDKGEIYYEITGEGEKQFTKSGTSTTDSIYVDESGRLHFKKNLSTSITIEAYVRDYENEEHGYSIELIGAANPITVLYLDEGKSGGYSMTIEATRTYFNSTAKKPIYLTAHVYKGTEEITNNVSYEWDTISDDDDGGSTDFVSYDKQIEVNRNDVSRQEIFQCAATLTDGSNLRFSDQIIIQDFLDDIYSDIMADGSLVLTPKNMSVTLTNRVYDATGRINENGDTESYKFTYTWKLLRSDTETDITGETGSSITIDLTKGTFSTLRENFSIACIATVNGEKARTVAFVNIFYSAISIDVNATSSVAINVDKDGNYTGTSFSAQVKFQLTDNEKNVLDYDSATSTINCQYSNKTTQTSGKWDFTFDLVFTKAQIDAFSNTSTNFIQITYTYLSEEHTYEIPIVKNYAGADGVSGTPAYNVYLTNDYYLFAGGDTAAISGQTVDFQIKVTYAGEEVDYTGVAVEKKDIDLSSATTTYAIIEGLKLQYTPSTKTFTLTTLSGSNSLFDGGVLIIEVKLPNNESIVKYFTYGINYNGNSYSLTPSENQFIYKIATTSFSTDSSNITLAATYAKNKQNVAYTEGYVTYSIDGADEIALTGSGNIYTFSISSANLTSANKEVAFYLYDEKGGQLLDKENLPVIISSEGMDIGGENLLYYSKTLMYDENIDSWSRGNTLERSNDENDFYYLITTENNSTSGTFINSPIIKNSEYYSDKEFCLSYSLTRSDITNPNWVMLVYIDDEGDKNNYDSETATKQVLSVDSQKSKDTLENDKECRYYHVFKLESQKNFYIRFTIYPTSTFKKPKLEIGNVPTDWSQNGFDNESYFENQLQQTKEELKGETEQTFKGLTAAIEDVFNIEEIDNDTGVKIIKEFKENDTEVSTEDYNEMRTFQIKKADGSYISLMSKEDMEKYLNLLNERNAKNINTYSTALIDSNFNEYLSSIVISPAHVDSTTKELVDGQIRILTDYYDEQKEKRQKEALRLRSDKISFFENNLEVAYISNSRFYITEGQILNTLILGGSEQDQHLKIYVDDTNVSVIWE